MTIAKSGTRRGSVSSLPTVSVVTGHRACKRCKRRFGAKGCSRRLCGACCALKGDSAAQECLAHVSHLRKAAKAKKRQGAFLLLASIKRIRREQQQKRPTARKAQHRMGVKKAKSIDDTDDGFEIVAVEGEDDRHDGHVGFAGIGAATLEALVAVQAEEIARLRRELKRTRVERESLKRKRIAVKQGLCIICEDHQPNVLLVPCGHCYCRDCVDGVLACPVCRTDIRKHYSYHPPAYICDEAVIASMGLPTSQPKAASALPTWHEAREDSLQEDEVDASDEEAYDVLDAWPVVTPSTGDHFDDILRRRSASNPHRVLFV